MHIKVLGPGCMNCNTLAKRISEAIKELEIIAEITKVEDYQIIAAYGIMKTPAMLIDEKIMFYGKVPTVRELKEIIIKNKG
jgi:small redox-active disulfide protein 2